MGGTNLPCGPSYASAPWRCIDGQLDSQRIVCAACRGIECQFDSLILYGWGLCWEDSFRVELLVVPEMPERIEFIELLLEGQVGIAYWGLHPRDQQNVGCVQYRRVEWKIRFCTRSDEDLGSSKEAIMPVVMTFIRCHHSVYVHDLSGPCL